MFVEQLLSMLIDEGLIRLRERVLARWPGHRPRRRAADDPGAPRSPTGLPRARRTSGHRACRGGRSGVRQGCSELPRAGPRTRQRRGSPRRADGQATRPSRPFAIARGGGVPLSPRPHPRHGLRRASSSAPARRSTSGSSSGRTASTARAPPSTRRSTATTWNRRTSTCPSWARSTRRGWRSGADAIAQVGIRREAGVRTRRYAGSREPARPRRSLLLEDDQRRLELLPDYGEALLQVGRFEEAEATVGEAIEKGDAAGLPGVAADARLVRLLVLLRTGEAESWRDEAAETDHARDGGLREAGRPCGPGEGLAVPRTGYTGLHVTSA